MPLRLWKKSVKMTLRQKRTFLIFCLMYSGLILLTSYSLERVIGATSTSFDSFSFLILLAISLFLAILYAWLIVSRNRRIYATYKCIGWTNSNINSIVLGQIIFTTLMGLLIVIEGLFHYNAIAVYVLTVINPTEIVSSIPFVSLGPVVIACFMFIAVQLLGYLMMKGKITKVRPMIALKRVGE